jgi:hypothetical protein
VETALSYFQGSPFEVVALVARIPVYPTISGSCTEYLPWFLLCGEIDRALEITYNILRTGFVIHLGKCSQPNKSEYITTQVETHVTRYAKALTIR